MRNIEELTYGSGEESKVITVQLWQQESPKICFQFAADATECVEELLTAIEEHVHGDAIFPYYLITEDQCDEEINDDRKLYNVCMAAFRCEAQCLNVRLVDELDQVMIGSVRFTPEGWTKSDEAQSLLVFEEYKKATSIQLVVLDENGEEIADDNQYGELNGPYTHGAKCNVCKAEIVGRRYKCLVCLNYDLCETCESNGKHDEHAVMRVVHPKTTEVPPYIERRRPLQPKIKKIIGPKKTTQNVKGRRRRSPRFL